MYRILIEAQNFPRRQYQTRLYCAKSNQVIINNHNKNIIGKKPSLGQFLTKVKTVGL